MTDKPESGSPMPFGADTLIIPFTWKRPQRQPPTSEMRPTEERLHHRPDDTASVDADPGQPNTDRAAFSRSIAPTQRNKPR